MISLEIGDTRKLGAGMDGRFSKLRFKEFAKSAAAGVIVGAVALQPTAARAFATNPFPAGNASWGIESSISTSNGISNTVSLAIGQGSLSGEALVGAFSGALAWHVNTAASAPGPGSLNLGGYHAPEGALPILVNETPNTAVGPTYTLAGLNVYVQLYFPASHSVARSILALQNTTGAPITVAVDNDSDLGTGMVALTSSGDATFDQTDNWFVTGTAVSNSVVASQRHARSNRVVRRNRSGRPDGDRPDVAPLPSVTMAFRDGQDAAPSSTISAGKGGIFGTGGSAFFERYTVTVPAGATRAVMVFAQMSDTVADAEATAPLFNSGLTLLATDYMGNLPDPVSNFAPFPVQQSDIVNWSFTSPIPVPTLTQWAQAGMALLLGLAGLLVGRRRFRSRASP